LGLVKHEKLKMRVSACAAAVLFILALSAGNALADSKDKFVFSGIQQDAEKMSFGLTDTVTGESRWLSIGQSISGYQLLSYAADTSTIVLEKEGAQISLPLAVAKIKPPVVAETVPPQNAIQVSINATDRKITVNGQTVPLGRLRAVLAEQAREMKGAPLILSAPEYANLDLVTAVMNGARQAGVSGVTLNTVSDE